jgi:N-acetylneuraminic acid mutarotase
LEAVDLRALALQYWNVVLSDCPGLRFIETRNPMLHRVSALLLASLLATSCASLPLGSAPAKGTLSLSLSGLFPAERQVQYLQAGKQAKVTVTGPGLAQPLTVTAPIDGSSAVATLTGIPAGPNRVIEVEAQDDAGASIPGGRFRTTATLQEGANSAVISPATTPRGDVFAKLLADGSALAGTLDAGRIQATIEEIQRVQRVSHFGLIDGVAIANALAANGGNVDALAVSDASFVQKAVALTVSVTGLPGNLPAEVWITDPVSPKQSGVFNGNLTIEPVKPGTWQVYGRAGTMRLGPIPVTPGPGAKAKLDFSRSTETLAPLMTPRAGAASGVLKIDGADRLVVAGGYGPNGADHVIAFDGESWFPLAAPMPVLVTHAAYAVHDNMLWVLGGFTGSGNASDAVQVFDGTTWARLADLPEPSILGSAAFVGDTLIFTGGYQGIVSIGDSNRFTLSAKIHTLDLNAGTGWTEVSALDVPRAGASAAALNGKFYLVGGQSEGLAPLTSIEVFDPISGTTASAAPIPTSRFGGMSWVAGGKLYVAGGVDPLGMGLNHVEAYDPLLDRWEILPPLQTPRAHAAIGQLNGKVVIAGGHDGLFYYGQLSLLDLVEALMP